MRAGELLRPATHVGIEREQRLPGDADEQRQAGVKGGVLVEEASGAAARAGIQAGDVILSVNDTPIQSVDQLRSVVSKAGKRVAILVQREEARIFVPVELG